MTFGRGVIAIFITLACRTLLAATTCTRPSYLSLRPPDYPPEALKAHATGKTIVLVSVGVDGKPTPISVKQSSGNIYLDKAAMKTVAQWRFKPAQCAGKSVRSSVLIPVNFTLTDSNVHTEWSVRHDHEPMKFESVNRGLAYLKGRKDLKRITHQSLEIFSQQKNARVWFVIKGPESNRIIFRQRQIRSKNGSVGLYAYLCEGRKVWCNRIATKLIADLKAFPMPPMPASGS